MKINFIIITLFISLKLVAQTTELKTYFYDNGEMERRGYENCVTNTYSAGKYTTCYSVGLWEYWYENGSKKLEVMDDNHLVKYINMWLPNGKQIITNGVGFYYETETGSDCDDSLMFQITDSIKQGSFNRYRLYNNGAYFLIEQGHYEHGMQNGLWIFKDSVLGIYEQVNYKNDEETGSYKAFYANGKLKEDGQKVNGKKEGLLKYYDEQGNLIMESTFYLDKESGKHIEYYANGNKKAEGQYIQTDGVKIGYVEDSMTPGVMHKKKEHIDNAVALDGEWKYYDENGKLIKTKVYKNKIRKDKE